MLILISDPDAPAMLERDIQREIGLTLAKARLAVALADGASIGSDTAETGLSEHTVRWTLKQVLSKTGTHQQCDLVASLRSLAGRSENTEVIARGDRRGSPSEGARWPRAPGHAIVALRSWTILAVDRVLERAVRRIVYDVAVSLDGFVAGPDGDISAFPADGDHLQPYLDRLPEYQTVIMGRRTYEFGYRFGLEPGARAYPQMDHHVFSRSLSLPEATDVTVVRENWDGALADLRNANGGDIYLCGGGAFAGLVANLGLLDLVRLKIAPVAIGSGVRLFEELVEPCRFKRTTITQYANGVTFAEYTVILTSSSADLKVAATWEWKPAPGKRLRQAEDTDSQALSIVYRHAVEGTGSNYLLSRSGRGMAVADTHT